MKKPLSLFLAVVILLATIPFAGVAQAMTGVELTPALARNDMVPLNGDYTYAFDQGGDITIQVMQNTPRPGWNTITWSTTGVQLTEVTIRSSGNTYTTTTYDPASSGPHTLVAKKNQILGMTFRGIPDQAPTYTVSFEPGTQGTFLTQTTSGLSMGDPTPVAPTPTGNPGYTFTGWEPILTATVTGDATYVARWTAAPTTYSVTYNGNTHTGGTIPIDANSPYLAAATVTVLGNTGMLTKTGFTFAGWNTMANGSGIAYAMGATFPMPATNVTLYAQWTALPTTYTVTYNGNTNTGGTIPVDANSPYLAGATVTVLGNTGALTKTGFNFAGWNTMANGSGIAYAMGATFPMPAANVTLYAQWTVLPTYTVTYNPGTQGTFLAQVTSGLLAGVNTPTAPTVTGNVGYTFTGWSPTPTATVTGNATYTAQWIAINYTVTFNSNGGDTNANPTSIGSIMYGDDVGTLPVAPTRVGYTFAGWNTAANGSGTAFLATTPVIANITVYAQWIALPTYTVTYNPGTQGTFLAQITPGLLAGVNTPTAPTVTGNLGYTFIGWSPTPTATVTGNATYTAQWAPITTYTVTYSPGTQGTFMAQITSGLLEGANTPAAPTATGNLGYTFTGWSPTPTATVTGNATYTAQWTAVVPTYTVTYNPGTQGTFATQTTTGLLAGVTTPVAPTVTGNVGYTFTGWSPTPTVTVTGNATYTAQWTTVLPTYTVTFLPGTQGTFATQTTSGLLAGVNTPVPPTVTGNVLYNFTGWIPTVSATVTGNATYTAQWSLIIQPTTYTVSYTSGTQGTFATQTNSGLPFGATTPTPPTVTGNAGYNFVGWSPTWSATVIGNVTYSAQWSLITEPTTFTVTYAPGTQGIFATQTNSGLTFGTTTPTPPTAVGNAGYAFLGWSPTWSATVVGNAAYTAQWSLINEPTTYTVSFVAGTQGAFATQTNSGLTFGTTTPTPPTATGNPNYTFVGWSPAVAATVTASVTYTAQWQPIFYTVVVNSGIGGSATGGGTFISGSIVTVAATAEADYDHDGWYENGVLVSSNNSYSFFVVRNRILDAEFAAEVVVIEPPAGPGLPDPIIPGAPELPATGELPFTFFYGIGSIITLAGIAIGRRRRK